MYRTLFTYLHCLFTSNILMTIIYSVFLIYYFSYFCILYALIKRLTLIEIAVRIPI